MIDIEISISNFVNFKFVKQHKLFTMILTKFIKFRLTNVKQTSRITQMIQIKFQLSDHVNEFWYFVTILKKFDIILNMFWIKQYKMNIDCQARFINFKFDYCLKNCIHNYQSIVIYNKKIKTFFAKQWLFSKINIAMIIISIFMKMIAKQKNFVCVI